MNPIPLGMLKERADDLISGAISNRQLTPLVAGEPVPVPPVATKPTVFEVGYGNFYGGYTNKDKDWYKREEKSAALALSLKASLWGMIEMHEENNMHKQFLGVINGLGGKFEIFPGKGGNHCFADTTRYDLVSSKNIRLYGGSGISRWHTNFVIKHLKTGRIFTFGVGHLIAGQTDARKKARPIQGAQVAETFKGVQYGILGIDKNDASLAKGRVDYYFNQVGLEPLRVKAIEQPVVNANLDSYGTGNSGRWIDDIYTNKNVKVRRAALVPTKGLSDHNWLRATIELLDLPQD